MNESSYERQLASFVVAMRESAVTRVLELGTKDESFLASVVRERTGPTRSSYTV